MHDENGNEYCTGKYTFDPKNYKIVFERELTDAELQELRDKGSALREEGAVGLRSCAMCNSAHFHLHDGEDFVLLCFACNRFWLGENDITNYTAIK